MHRSSGGPLIRFPNFVTPLLGGHIDLSNLRRRPTDTDSFCESSYVGYSTVSSSTIVTTRQCFIPGRRFKSATLSEASTISSAPPHLRTSSATTASFSTGLNEHVLYTMYPPTLSSAAPLCAIRSCSWCNPSQTPVATRTKSEGSLKRAVAEHGTSQIMRSYTPSGYRPESSRVAAGAGSRLDVRASSPPPAQALWIPSGNVRMDARFGNHCAWWFVTISDPSPRPMRRIA